MMRPAKVTAAALSLLLLAATLIPPASAAPFPDVSGWALPYVEEALSRGLVEGTGDGRFQPERTLTGREFAALLIRAFFPDRVDPPSATGAWYEPYVAAAARVGLFRNTSFAGEGADSAAPVSRTEMAQMMANTLDASGVPSLTGEQKTAVRGRIPDLALTPETRQDGVLTAYAYQLLTGTDSLGTFSGSATMTRAQAAAVLVRMVHLQESGYPLAPLTPLTTSLDQGPFDVPLAGAMGCALADTGSLQAGTPFTILGERGDSLRVLLADSTQRDIPKTHALVNVPDVIPSMLCRNVNAEANRFRILGEPFIREGTVVTGTKLYDARGMNLRLGREEFFMPVSYHMAVRLNAAQKAAMSRGLSLVLYEGYRPAATQQLLSSCLMEMRSQRSDFRAATAYGHFNPAYYVNTASGGIGSHQKGSAVDISLATVQSTRELTIGGATVQVPLTYTEFSSGTVVTGEAARATGNPTVELGNAICSVQVDRSSPTAMPTPITETSFLSSTFEDIYSGFSTYSETQWKQLRPSLWWTRGAQTLQDLMVEAGLTPLASEWWHFNDIPAYRQVTDHGKDYSGLGSFTPVQYGICSTTWEYALHLAGETG